MSGLDLITLIDLWLRQVKCINHVYFIVLFCISLLLNTQIIVSKPGIIKLVIVVVRGLPVFVTGPGPAPELGGA